MNEVRKALVATLVARSPVPAKQRAALALRLAELPEAELKAMKARSDLLEDRVTRPSAEDLSTASPSAIRRDAALAELRRVAQAYVARTVEEPVDTARAEQARDAQDDRLDLEGSASAATRSLDDSVRLWRRLERSDERRELLTRAEKLTRDWLAHIASELEFKGAPLNREVIDALASTRESTLLVGLALDQLSRDWLRLIRFEVASRGSLALGPGSRWQADLARFLLSDATLASPALEPAVMLTDRSLPRTRLIEGLAKLAYFIKDSPVDTIVSIGKGGGILGDFVAGQGSTAKRHMIDWSISRRAYRFANIRKLDASGQRVFLIADVAQDVSSMLDVHRQISNRLVGAEIHFLVLAGSAQVREAMTERGITYVSNIVGDAHIDLPWSRDGGYQVLKQSHVFGAGTEKEWRVPIRELNRTIRDIEVTD